MVIDDAWRFARLRLNTGFQEVSITSDLTNQSDRALAMAIDGTYMYVLGTEGHGFAADGRWHIEKRRLATLALDPAFGVGGVLSINPSPRPDLPTAIAMDATSMIVVGMARDGIAQSGQWRVEKRLLADGSLNPAFGNGGVLSFDFSDLAEGATAVALNQQSLYIAGIDRSPGNWQVRIEKRFWSDGSLVSTFGTQGVLTLNPTAGDDWMATLLCVGGNLYAGGRDAGGGGEWRIERRNQ